MRRVACVKPVGGLFFDCLLAADIWEGGSGLAFWENRTAANGAAQNCDSCNCTENIRKKSMPINQSFVDWERTFSHLGFQVLFEFTKPCLLIWDRSFKVKVGKKSMPMNQYLLDWKNSFSDTSPGYVFTTPWYVFITVIVLFWTAKTRLKMFRNSR